MTDPSVFKSGETGGTTSLLARAKALQPGAWERLVGLYGPLVYRWCRRWGLQPADAENVGQELFARVAKGLATFDPGRSGGSFRGWLYRIARNCYTDYLRRLKREPPGVGGSDAGVADQATVDDVEQASTKEDAILLYRQALDLVKSEFSDRDWNAFYQVVAEEKSPADVAAQLGVSVNVVYLAKARVLRRLREEFADLISDAELSKGFGNADTGPAPTG